MDLLFNILFKQYHKHVLKENIQTLNEVSNVTTKKNVNIKFWLQGKSEVYINMHVLIIYRFSSKNRFPFNMKMKNNVDVDV